MQTHPATFQPPVGNIAKRTANKTDRTTEGVAATWYAIFMQQNGTLGWCYIVDIREKFHVIL
jgi:hypothetical protein